MEKGHSMDVSRFGLEFNPFLKNSKEILVETAQYREALFRLSHLAKTKGFGLLTGGPGRGKTTALIFMPCCTLIPLILIFPFHPSLCLYSTFFIDF